MKSSPRKEENETDDRFIKRGEIWPIRRSFKCGFSLLRYMAVTLNYCIYREEGECLKGRAIRREIKTMLRRFSANKKDKIHASFHYLVQGVCNHLDFDAWNLFIYWFRVGFRPGFVAELG